MTEFSRLSAGLGGIPAPVTALAALHVHTPVNLMAWGSDAATQAAVAASGSSLASLGAAMHAADGSFDAGDGQHMAGLSNLVVVARANCDRSAQRRGELALGSSASASSSDQEKKKNDAYVRSAYGSVGTMLITITYASFGNGVADVELARGGSAAFFRLSPGRFVGVQPSGGDAHGSVRRLLSACLGWVSADSWEGACSCWGGAPPGLSRAPGARCRWDAGACPQHGEPRSL